MNLLKKTYFNNPNNMKIFLHLNSIVLAKYIFIQDWFYPKLVNNLNPFVLGISKLERFDFL